MRKKLLRSRSGFEKPESREEAIMQNILGASNVLEPPESNIEEILQAILYNTPYTKEPETKIEEILLAIKNNGTYTGECESRDMKILFAILNESTYNEKAESRIEELFIEWLYQKTSIKVLEGVPPLLFKANGDPLLDWQISGNTQGVGDKTSNLFDIKKAQASSQYVTSTGEVVPSTPNWYASGLIEVSPSTTYIRCVDGVAVGNYILTYDANRNFVVAYQPGTGVPFTVPEGVTYVAFNINTDTSNISRFSFVESSTPLPYEPYGYKIPVSCGGVTTDIYIGDSPLYDGDTISMADTGIEIPTVHGNNVLIVDTTVQPSSVYIEYK